MQEARTGFQQPFSRDATLDESLRIRTDSLAQDAARYASVVEGGGNGSLMALGRDFNLGPDDLMYLRRAPAGAAIDVSSLIRTNGKLGRFLGLSFAAPLMALGVDVEKMKSTSKEGEIPPEDRSLWSGWQGCSLEVIYSAPLLYVRNSRAFLLQSRYRRRIPWRQKETHGRPAVAPFARITFFAVMTFA